MCDFCDHRLQHTRLLCLSLSPRVCSNSNPLTQSCHPTILSSVMLFSSCSQTFPASGSFPLVSSLHHVVKLLQVQLQHQSYQWILSGLTSFRIDGFELIAVQGTLKSLPQHHSLKACSSVLNLLYVHSHIHICLLGNHSFDYKDLCWNSDFSYTVEVCHIFTYKEKGLLISWLQLLSAVILEPKERKSVTVSGFPTFFSCHIVLGLEFMSIIFLDVYGVDTDPSYFHNSSFKK